MQYRCVSVVLITTLIVVSRADCQSDCGVVALGAQIGITAEAVVVAGLEVAEVEQTLNRLSEASELCALLSDQKVAAAEMAASLTALREQIMSTNDNDAVVAEHASVLSALAAQLATISATRQQLRDVALEGIAPAKRALLEVWRASGSYRAPGHFKVVSRSHADWKAIERALRAESRAVRRGETLDPEYAGLLAEVRSDPAVAAAEVQLELGLSVAEAVFSQYQGS